MSYIQKFKKSVIAFFQREDAVTAIEYGLLAALIAVVIIVGASLLGTNLNTLFNQIGQCLANPSAGCTIGG